MKLARQVAVRHPVGTAAERRRHARAAVRVSISRALAAAMCMPIVVLASGTSPGPSAVDETRTLVRVYAFEAFPQWALAHHEEACPRAIAELSAVAGRMHARDAWGTELELRCGNGVRGAFVRSAGPDRRFETADDITSNDGGGDG